MKKMLHPDAGTSSGAISATSAPVTDTHIRHHENVPDKAVDLLDVGQKVSLK